MYAVIKVAASCCLNSEYSSRAKWFQTRFSKWRMPKVLITLTGIPDYILLVRGAEGLWRWTVTSGDREGHLVDGNSVKHGCGSGPFFSDPDPT